MPQPEMRASQAGKGSSPLEGRACCNWQSNFLLLNLATLVAGIFFTYSIGFPILALGLTVLGVVEVLLYHAATKNDPDTPTFAEYQQLKTAHKAALATIREGVGKAEKAALDAQIADLQQQLQATEEPMAELEELQARAGTVKEHARLTDELPALRQQMEEAQAAFVKRAVETEVLEARIQKATRASERVVREIQTKTAEKERAVHAMAERVEELTRLEEQIAAKKAELAALEN
jgi:predicted  nucleic acid-binding Zn-ribbon protein